jgi:hypothetical protein
MNVDWTAVGAVATAAAALITAWMAAMTRGSIRQTQRHHRDAFRPLVVFMPYDGIDPQARKELIDFKATVEGSRVYALELRGTLQNIGVGPALNLRLRLAVLNPEDFRATCELSPMKTGEFRQARQHELGGPFPIDPSGATIRRVQRHRFSDDPEWSVVHLSGIRRRLWTALPDLPRLEPACPLDDDRNLPG